MKSSRVDESEHVAREQHDLVLQRLFAVGMELQALRGSGPADRRGDGLDRVLDQLDLTIREVRSAIRTLDDRQL